jgi:hypothetical protein
MDLSRLQPANAADGVIVEMLPERRCSVRLLEDGRVVVCRIPDFDTRYSEPYYPEPGHPVTVLLEVLPDLDGEFLLVGFPLLPLRRT